MITPMPPEIIDYIRSLEPASVNNSREIVRSIWKSVEHLHPVQIAWVLEKRLGIRLDPDRTANDYGGEPEGWGREYEPINISDEELAELL